ncbi:MAG: hypothetical protein HND39_11240 [Ignavibacteriota bacterium]|jgi:uncharacterized membrane protein|nr:CopD family protein [Ignavibacteriales bacterium]MCC7094386.1 CopD family protein [Ignavibacteriaceae bacterium]MEB2297851.1 CopD family protein [Ignavibacteria bacterium]QKJ96806.1 MAG: hypothetical protein HND39_11240 [Ignavibacteriota bacterium]MCZ7613876.1 CopD family protein [Ignavibacteriaceae bacterium]
MANQIINFLHLLATSVWIGGMIYMHLILLPSLKLIDAQQSGKLMGIISKKFSITAWISIIILLITGYLKTPAEMLLNTSSQSGIILTAKHILILCVIAVGLIIAIRIVPKLRGSMPKPGEAPQAEFIKSQKILHTLATINLTLGLLIIVLASMLW